jgi:hypothetical protein
MTIHWADLVYLWEAIKFWGCFFGIIVVGFFLYYRIVFYPTRLAEQRGVRNPLIGSANMLVKTPTEWFALPNYAGNAEPTDHAQARERFTMAAAFGDAIDARTASQWRPAPPGRPEPPTFDGEAEAAPSRPVPTRPVRPHPYGPRPTAAAPPRLRGPADRREPHF